MDMVHLIEDSLGGRILGCSEGVFLVHFPPKKYAGYAVGYALMYLEDGDKCVIKGRKDVRTKIYDDRPDMTRSDAEGLGRSLENPRELESFINFEAHPRPRKMQIPMTPALAARIGKELQAQNQSWEVVYTGRMHVVAFRSGTVPDGGYALLSYVSTLPSMAFPPCDMLDITPEQAERFRSGSADMVRYFREHNRKPR